jgi:hypothetical protein
VRGVGSDVDAEIDDLYANAPDAFTKKRDELAKRLKADGRADIAATVKALRKPTQIAYVLNQVTRRFADEIGELVDVGRELARAQRKALRGGDASGDLRAAIGRQRDVVRDLTTKTGGLMRELGIAATGHLDEIAGALQAALVDPIVGAQLEEGRLDKVPSAAAGFPGASPPREVEAEREIPPPPKSAPRKKTAQQRKADARAAKREAAERAREEKERTREAKERAKREAVRKKLDAKAAARAEQRAVALEHARAAWEEAKARAETLGAEATEARRTAETLRAEAKRLAKEAKETARAATQTEATADKSEKAATTAEHAAKRLATKARAK